MDNQEEFKKCAASCEHFLNECKIHSPKQGLINFSPYPYQKRWIEHIEKNRFSLATKFRQGGFTTSTLLYLLHKCMFSLNKTAMILCRSDHEAIECNQKVRQALKHLPEWLQPKLEKQNDHEIKFADTDGRMIFGVPVQACGVAIDYLFVDDAAFIKDFDKHWKAMYPTLSCGGSDAIALSTPNGTKNWFYETYKRAQRKENNFEIFWADYYEHPDYNSSQWKKQMQEQLGEAGWCREVLQSFLT